MPVVQLVVGDILSLQVEAIVCPAHKHLIRGRGLSAQIYDQAGQALADECHQAERCKLGEARLTRAYNMPARFILHTVTPQWSGGDQWGGSAIDQLRQCYNSVLELALENSIRSVAFPALSTGTNRMPHSIAAHVALEELHRHEDRFTHLICCLRSMSVLHEWETINHRFFKKH